MEWDIKLGKNARTWDLSLVWKSSHSILYWRDLTNVSTRNLKTVCLNCNQERIHNRLEPDD